jgi:hypothetical protein
MIVPQSSCHLEAASPWGLWAVRARRSVRTEVRVYPNLFTERKSVAALFLNRGNFGARALRQVGQGRDFEKLRDYVHGASYDEIHWKATAKRGRPVTKVFQIERTQELYVIIDASRLSARPTQVAGCGLQVGDSLGGIACLASRRAQRLGDFAANTIVVRNPKIQEPDLNQLPASKFNSLREYPHLAARLHQRVSPGEARVALQALIRRDELNAQERVELFSEIAAHFRSLVEFPPETTEGITDEQYVRNVVDILFRPQRPVSV